MAKGLDPIIESSPSVSPVMSPTGLTNSIRMRRSNRAGYAVKSPPKQMGFLAAELFSTMSLPSRESTASKDFLKPSSPGQSNSGRMRARPEMGSLVRNFQPPQFTVSNLSCKSRDRAPPLHDRAKSKGSNENQEHGTSSDEPKLGTPEMGTLVGNFQPPQFTLSNLSYKSKDLAPTVDDHAESKGSNEKEEHNIFSAKPKMTNAEFLSDFFINKLSTNSKESKDEILRSPQSSTKSKASSDESLLQTPKSKGSKEKLFLHPKSASAFSPQKNPGKSTVKASSKAAASNKLFVIPMEIRTNLRGCRKESRFSSGNKQDSRLLGCISTANNRKRQLDTCTTNAIYVYQKGCTSRRAKSSKGFNRGVDKEFFVEATLSETSSTSAENEKPISVASTLTCRTEPKAERAELEEDLPFRKPFEENIRKRTRRFPDAELAENPNDARLEEMTRQSPVEEERESAVLNTSEDETPLGLRNLRLKLFKDYDESILPKARLSRALNDLTIQDGAIYSLQKELGNTLKNRSDEAQEEKDELKHKYEQTINGLRLQSEQEKQAIEAKLVVASEKNVTLQRRMEVLQIEMSRIRSSLHSAKVDLAKQSDRWTETREGQSSSPDNPKNESSSLVDSSLILALRAQVAELKKQLATAQALAASTDASPKHESLQNPGGPFGSSRVVVSRLRIKLRQTEAELRELKEREGAIGSFKGVSVTEKDLIKALAKSKEETTRATAKEDQFRKALELTMKELESVKRARQVDGDNSKAAMREMSERFARDMEEAERRHAKATEELNHLRMEVEELKKEISTSIQLLAEAKQETKQEADARAADNLELTTKLQFSDQSNQVLSDAVEELKMKLVLAEEAAAKVIERELHDDVSTARRNAKWSIAEESPEDIKALKNESMIARALEAQLEASRVNESSLRSELILPKQLLKQAKDRASNGRAIDDAMATIRDVEEQNVPLQVEKLSAAAHEFASEARASEHGELQTMKAREKYLEGEVLGRRARLENAEMQMKYEIYRVKEENLVAEASERQKRESIEELESRLQMATGKDSEHGLLETSEVLKARLQAAEEEVLRVKEKAAEEIRHSDLATSKLRSELALMSAKFYAARKEVNETPPEHNQSYISSAVSSLTNGDLSPGRSMSNDDLRSPPLSPPKINKMSYPNSLGLTLDRVDGTYQARGVSPITRKPPPYRSSRSPASKLTAKSPPSGFEGLDENMEEKDLNPSIDDQDEVDSTIERFDINGLQLRMLESSKRLTDATFKLKGLVISGDELKVQQLKTQNRANDLTTIANRLSSPRSGSPYSLSQTSSCPVRVVSPEEKKVRTSTPSVEAVLEKYRKYKENKLTVVSQVPNKH